MRNIKRIGVIGAGKHFKKNVYPVLKKSKSYKIISFLKHKKKNFEGHTFISEKEFFKEKLDFVYIATPNHLHDKYIIKSLEANFHVICEKPFVIKKKNIQKILNLSKYKKRLIFESFMYMYHPIFNEIKKIIESNKFGKLRGEARKPINPRVAKITYNILKKYAKTPSFGENILKILGFTDKDTKMLMAITTAKKSIIMDKHPDLDISNIDSRQKKAFLKSLEEE